LIVSIVGLGLIGGSFALSLKECGFSKEIIGIDQSIDHQKLALEIGIADRILVLEEAIPISDLVIIAIPVDSTIKILPKILDLAGEKTAVMDAGSTKKFILESIKNHPKRRNFIGTHPMSGTENSGPSAAFSGLFSDKVAIICEKENSFDWVVSSAESVYNSMKSRILYMDAMAHDEHVGYVSHLSHVISYALAVAVLEKEKSTSTIFDLAAGGFASTARLAKSSSKMWTPIFEQNAENILPILDLYMEKLTDFKTYLQNGDMKSISGFIDEANKIRRILDKK